MRDNVIKHSRHGLENHGLYNLNDIYWNLPTPALYEQALDRHEGLLSHLGPLVVRTGHHTGRSADDKFIVDEEGSHDLIWWGSINRPIPEYRMPIRIITEYAWHSLFARNMFIKAKTEELENHVPEFTVINSPRFHATPVQDHTQSETFILVNFHRRLVLIGGTSYAGEIKKSIFSVMNYLLPDKGVLPMHCSANIGADGKTAFFFGLAVPVKILCLQTSHVY